MEGNISRYFFAEAKFLDYKYVRHYKAAAAAVVAAVAVAAAERLSLGTTYQPVKGCLWLGTPYQPVINKCIYTQTSPATLFPHSARNIIDPLHSGRKYPQNTAMIVRKYFQK